MSQKLVLLDANLLIAAYDPDAERTDDQRNEAREVIETLSLDSEVKFVTTPLIRYEVLCGVKRREVFNDLLAVLNGYKLFELKNNEADCAIEIFRLSRQKSIDLKNKEEPKKYKFDLFHVAAASVNALDFQSRDEGVEKMKVLALKLRSI
jgi:predicted nucleic acid-binding protein